MVPGAEIDATVLRDQPVYVVRELLMAVWREQRWPLQSMGFAQWEQLTEMLLADGDPVSTKRTFPGKVVVARQGETITARRIS